MWTIRYLGTSSPTQYNSGLRKTVFEDKKMELWALREVPRPTWLPPLQHSSTLAWQSLWKAPLNKVQCKAAVHKVQQEPKGQFISNFKSATETGSASHALGQGDSFVSFSTKPEKQVQVQLFPCRLSTHTYLFPHFPTGRLSIHTLIFFQIPGLAF